MQELDCLQPLPTHLLATYDIVHIQLFHLAIHNNDPVPYIKNLIQLLSRPAAQILSCPELTPNRARRLDLMG